MQENSSDKYKYVDAEVVRRAALFNDDNAFNIIFERYEKHLEKMIRRVAGKFHMSLDDYSIQDLKQTVWIDVRNDVRKFRPR